LVGAAGTGRPHTLGTAIESLDRGTNRMDDRRLLCVMAHPDDESLGAGGTLAKYAAEGVGVFLVTASRGERGWPGNPADHPGPQALAVLREAELRAAGAVLGLDEVELLDLPDGAVDRVAPSMVIPRIVATIRRVRPQVVLTFPPDGITGHPDHVAVSQLTTAAVVYAADSTFGEGAAHRVAKLYYLAPSRESLALYGAAFGDPAICINSEKRHAPGWPSWAITTRINATGHWRTVARAVACHQTQFPNPDALSRLPPSTHRRLWGQQELYRVFGAVRDGPGAEDDLFAGLR
jgi:LmbE family N-acetylglucosaminyl deacetylase